jgi:inward rectifier potassium channel
VAADDAAAARKAKNKGQIVTVATASQGSAYRVRILGAPRPPLSDFYHTLLRLSWTRTMALVALGYLLANAAFAVLYFMTDGIANARPGSFLDDFYFSVQTMGTIGYGAMYPKTDLANLLVVMESTASLVIMALTTGLVFAKFSRPTARLMFSRHATISPMDGVPTLSFRMSNQRANRIVEATIHVAVVKTEHTQEGKLFYRTYDLKLTRERVLSLSRSWTAMHAIDETSPLWGETPESLQEKEAEILVSVAGTDDTWMQNVHANHRYEDSQIVWGHRHQDIVSDEKDLFTLDLTKFHDLEPSEPSETFPYPRR